MLYAGLDLSRKRLDFHLLDGEGATVELGAAPADVDGLLGLTRRLGAERSSRSSPSGTVQRVRSPLRDGDPLPSGYRRRFTVTVNAALAVLALVSVVSQRTLVRPTLKRLPDFG